MYDLFVSDFHISLFYSVLKLFTGFAIAAFIAWKLTVVMANKTVAKATTAKTFHVIVVR